MSDASTVIGYALVVIAAALSVTVVFLIEIADYLKRIAKRVDGRDA